VLYRAFGGAPFLKDENLLQLDFKNIHAILKPKLSDFQVCRRYKEAEVEL
jgi:hypothetical protein